MLKLLREVLKVGEATLLYPFVPAEVMPGFRGKPHHDPKLCIACAACAIACPANALELTNDLDQGIRTWSLFMGLCIYCARCEEVCPTGAIKLSQDFELAVMNREDLFERVRLQACSLPEMREVFCTRQGNQLYVCVDAAKPVFRQKPGERPASARNLPGMQTRERYPKTGKPFQEAVGCRVIMDIANRSKEAAMPSIEDPQAGQLKGALAERYPAFDLCLSGGLRRLQWLRNRDFCSNHPDF